MTLSELMRDLSRAGAPCGFHTSAQKSSRVWAIAVRFYASQFRSD